MGKWIVIGLIAAVVLGGVGFAVYKLTNLPEQAQEWWDEKRLDNFETLANREIDDFEKKIASLEETEHKKRVELKIWAGDESFGDKNFNEQKDTGFKTLWGYNKLIERRTKQGEALASAYQAKVKEGGADIATGNPAELKADALVAVKLPLPDGSIDNRNMKASEILEQLGNIEGDLSVMEIEKKGVEEVVDQYNTVIKEIGEQIVAMKDSLKDMRQQVKLISAQIKVQKAKEDLAELNKAIRGQGGKSELGTMIAKYEQRKTKFKAEELVNAEKKGDTKVSISDLDKPSTPTTKKSRFMP